MAFLHVQKQHLSLPELFASPKDIVQWVWRGAAHQAHMEGGPDQGLCTLLVCDVKV